MSTNTNANTSTSKKVNKLRDDLVYNPIIKPSSLKKRFDNVSQNSQFEVSKSGMSSAEKAAAYKEWGIRLAAQAKAQNEVQNAVQNTVKKGGSRKRKNKTLRKRKNKTLRKRKRNSKMWLHY